MNKIAGSLFWRILQQYSAYIIKIAVQTVLARVLMPEEYGTAALVCAFVGIAETIAVSGMGTALVQKKDPDRIDYGTILTGSMIVSCVIYGMLFVCAPLIASYYQKEDVVLVLRVYGIMIFLGSYAAVQNAYIVKNFEFKKNFIATLAATAVSGAVSIWLALYGYGIWALVFQSIIFNFVTVTALHMLVRWRPVFLFDKSRFKSLFSFSWKVLVSGLLGTFIENIYNMSIGKLYGDLMLGYYNRGNTYPAAVIGQTRSAIRNVLLPVFSSVQDEQDTLRKLIKKMTHLSVLLIFPMAFGLAAIAEPFVKWLLTDKWLPCVFFLRLECIFYGSLPIATALGEGLTAVGRSDIPLKNEILKMTAAVSSIALLAGTDIRILCLARTVIAFLTILYSTAAARKFIGYQFRDLASDIYKPFLLSLFMSCMIYPLSQTGLPVFLILVMQMVLGIGIYAGGMFIWMKSDADEIVRYIKSHIS